MSVVYLFQSVSRGEYSIKIFLNEYAKKKKKKKLHWLVLRDIYEQISLRVPF